MKKIVIIALFLVLGSKLFSQNTFKFPVTIEGKTVTGAKIDNYDGAVSTLSGAVDGNNIVVLTEDSLDTKPYNYVTRYDYRYDPTNNEIWKLWKLGGSDIKPLMPCYPLVNVGGTALVDGRLYLYRFFTPYTTTINGFRVVLSTAGSYTGDNYNGIVLYRYSNDSVIEVGRTTNSATFWQITANTSTDKALSAPVTIGPGFYAVAPIYNNSSQSVAPAIEAPFISAIAKSVTFTGGWRTTSYINAVGTPAANYKYTAVSGESTVPHIILTY